MKDNRDFDILENADDRVIDTLSEVPVLTSKDKKRILVESKRKLSSKQRAAGIKQFTDADQVSGVERYSRPKWRIFAGVAACFVLAGSVTVTLLALNKGDKVPVKQYPTTPAAVTDESTTDSTETASDKNEMYISPEKYEACKTAAADLVNKMENLDAISHGANVEVDKSEVKIVPGTETDPGDMTYYRVTDERFRTMDDFRNFVSEFVAEPYYTQVMAHLIDTEVSAHIFREIDGQLYFRSEDDFKVKASDMKMEITGEPEAVITDDTQFSFSVSTSQNGTPMTTTGKAVLIDGNYKLTEYSISAADENASAPEETGTDVSQSDPYVGLYTEELSHRCQIEIKKSENFDTYLTYNVTIHWASSAFDSSEWNMSGQFNGRGVLNYSDCECKRFVTGEDGTISENVEYSNGTGYIQMSERGDKTGIIWNDDNFTTAKDYFYEKADTADSSALSD